MVLHEGQVENATHPEAGETKMPAEEAVHVKQLRLSCDKTGKECQKPEYDAKPQTQTYEPGRDFLTEYAGQSGQQKEYNGKVNNAGV